MSLETKEEFIWIGQTISNKNWVVFSRRYSEKEAESFKGFSELKKTLDISSNILNSMHTYYFNRFIELQHGGSYLHV